MIGKNFPELNVVDDKQVNIIEKAPLSTLCSSSCDKKSRKKQLIREIIDLLEDL